MIKRSYEISLKRDQALYLWCLGDVGYTGPRCDATELERDIRWVLRRKKEGHQVRVVGLGDWCAFPSPTERAALVATKGGKGLYDSTLGIIDEAIKERCDGFIKLVEPFNGDFLGTVHGHHLYDFTGQSDKTVKLRRVNSDEYMCDSLGCDYYGDVGHIRLRINDFQWDAAVHHGYGSGRTRGTLLGKRHRAFETFTNSDCILMGHDNARMVDCLNGFDRDGRDRIVTKERRVIGTGAYERAYRIGEAHNGYVEEALLTPTAIGGTVLLFEEWEKKLRVRALV